MTRYGPNGGVDRVRVTGLDLETLRQRILSGPDEVTKQVAADMQRVAAQAVRDIRKTIENSPTKTGYDAAAKGLRGGPGRERGKGEAAASSRPRTSSGGRSMKDSVDQSVKINRRSISMAFGWITGRPGYAFFQEYGTSNGVPAMHALTDASQRAHAELRKVLKRVRYRVNR